MNILYSVLCNVTAALSLTVCVQAAPADGLHLERIELPAGFKIELFARVPNARAMSLGEHTLFVGSMNDGTVHAVELQSSVSGGARVIRAGKVWQVATGLRLPAGVAWYRGDLYVSAVDRILRFPAIEEHLASPPVPQIVTSELPNTTWHGARYLRFSPDGWLYVAVGAPCNVCLPEQGGVILRMRPDGSNSIVFARGVRNSVGFDWNPEDQSLWFTDNGRDMLGDDIPPCELNHATAAGQHFGFPYCHAGSIVDPEFGRGYPCSLFTSPAQALGAHVAPLGMRFYTGTLFPPRYRQQIFIAEHGSWNRSQKSGYRISLVRLDGNGKVIAYENFASGWLDYERYWGRPVDLEMLPDGSLLVSDDVAGAIYRISVEADFKFQPAPTR